MCKALGSTPSTNQSIKEKEKKYRVGANLWKLLPEN
jgi:hypothetical protein